MKFQMLPLAACALILCTVIIGCSSDESSDDPSTTAGQADDPKNGSDADANKNEGGSDNGSKDGDGATDENPPPKKPTGPSDDEITQFFKDAGVDGGFRRRGEGIAVLAVVGEGKEGEAFEKLFASLTQTTSITLDYNPDAFLQRPDVSVAGLAQLPKLTDLIARRITIDPKTLGGLQSLKRLDLTRSQVSDELLAQIATLNKLQQLNLSGTNITDENLKHLAGMKNLVMLDLSNTSVTVAAARELRKSIAYLKIKVSKSREPERESDPDPQPDPAPAPQPDAQPE
jgi:hypothetical protein